MYVCVYTYTYVKNSQKGTSALRVLQSIAGYCSLLQFVAVYRSLLQSIAVHLKRGQAKQVCFSLLQVDEENPTRSSSLGGA